MKIIILINFILVSVSAREFGSFCVSDWYCGPGKECQEGECVVIGYKPRDEPPPESLEVEAGNKTFVVKTAPETTWFMAMIFCSWSAGLQPASIDSQEELDSLRDALNKNYDKGSRFWTSGNDIFVKGEYTWGLEGKFEPYGGWGEEEPNHYNHSSGIEERCVELLNQYGTFVYNDNLCSNKAGVICQKY